MHACHGCRRLACTVMLPTKAAQPSTSRAPDTSQGLANMADNPAIKDRKTPYEMITNQVIEQMKNCKEPWQRPWAWPGLTMPANASTERGYNGVNVPLLWGTDQRGYAQNRWATFQQWKESGATIPHGYTRAYYDSQARRNSPAGQVRFQGGRWCDGGRELLLDRVP